MDPAFGPERCDLRLDRLPLVFGEVSVQGPPQECKALGDPAVAVDHAHPDQGSQLRYRQAKTGCS